MSNFPIADNTFVIVQFSASHTKALTSLWREAHADVTGISPIHPFEGQAEYFKTVLTEQYRVFTALTSTDNLPVGFIAVSDDEISQLYIHPNFKV
ncbi:hypothetical protein [Veronia nyctiphanis]|uniref:hypothetical protein n=1 Tax=Veronia nyctiphanis TaxID=1278244 RepID=UPI001F274B92|nr:hypothetical protein [Veronia nyctiphanis]